MPLSIVANVAFDANAAHARGESRRPAAKARPPRQPADATPADNLILEAAPDVGEEANDVPASTAGLSILAQALAAYSEN